MLLEEAELVESRVDWITATALLDKDTRSFDPDALGDLSTRILWNQEKAKNVTHYWQWQGFSGFKCGQAQIGTNGRGYIFRLSGDAAAEFWPMVYQLSTNVTRLDVAATIRHDGAWVDRAIYHHAEALEYQKNHAPNLKVTLIDGGKFGRTLNIGSRVSDSYGRIYDKERESKRLEYRDCWRYEVEFKRDLAERACALLDPAADDHGDPAGMALAWFDRRQIRSGQLLKTAYVPVGHKSSSDALRSLEWITRSVRGTVETLIAMGLTQETLAALGLFADTLAEAGYLRQPGRSADEEMEAQSECTQRQLSLESA
jgi:Replication initiation factor